ncbi:hypothetical protein Hanom_Chr12g01124051 [Helianthus anomalus]
MPMIPSPSGWEEVRSFPLRGFFWRGAGSSPLWYQYWVIPVRLDLRGGLGFEPAVRANFLRGVNR